MLNISENMNILYPNKKTEHKVYKRTSSKEVALDTHAHDGRHDIPFWNISSENIAKITSAHTFLSFVESGVFDAL